MPFLVLGLRRALNSEGRFGELGLNHVNLGTEGHDLRDGEPRDG